jgi:hypothetical protein
MRLRSKVGRSRIRSAGGIHQERIPEITRIVGSILRYALNRVGNVLLEEWPRARCEHCPYGSSPSVRVTAGRKVPPRRHQLVRQSDFGSLQLAWLAGGLVHARASRHYRRSK